MMTAGDGPGHPSCEKALSELAVAPMPTKAERRSAAGTGKLAILDVPRSIPGDPHRLGIAIDPEPFVECGVVGDRAETG